ncbi:MAG: LicD family protein [Idiomarina sp.]|nr:LicD family protein [Idiomarina sp.]
MLDNEFRDELLEVLRTFHEFCETHGLKYYLIGGGLIGAVRHGGFIPWDDDIDVALSRDDFQKLIALQDKVPAGFKLQEPFLGDEYSNTMVRMHSTRLLVQQDFLKKFNIGPWIDVFPLDNTFDNRLARKAHFFAAYLLKVFSASRLGGVQVTGSVKAKLKLLLYYVLRPIPLRWCAGAYNKVMMLKRKPGTYMANLTGRWREKEIIARPELAKRALYDFETIKVYSFADYDKWLGRVYGSYMELPKEQDRVPDHSLDRVE